MKKRVLCMLIVLCAALLLSPLKAYAADALTVTIDTGAEVTLVDADSDGYYDIGTADELYAFAAAVNGGSRSINGELTADITVNTGVMVNGSLAADTSGFRVWTPIGNSSVAFSGNFNGNDYTVYGLYFSDKSVDYVGLIGRSAGWNTVRNVRVSGSYLFGYGYVGGVVGYSGYGGSITSCYYSGVAKGAGTRVGGVVGNNHCGTIMDCGNDAEITAGNTSGGITGYNYNGTILRCYNTGEVYGALDVGGIAGVSSSGGEVRDCYNTGYIYGWNYIGGIVGSNGSSISGCYNTGEILAKDSCAGGIAGDSLSNAAVSSCYNTGNISASDYSCGGIIGYLYGTVVNCYNSGNIETIRNCGGIVGTCTTVTIANCYNSGNTILGNSKGGGISGDDDERAVFIKCYYLTGTARGAVYDHDLAGHAEAWDDFSTGEIAWILGQGVTLSQKTDETDDQGNAIYEDVFYSGEIWGQNIDRAEPYDLYPVFSEDTVYYGYADCYATEKSYSNSECYETSGHVYIKGTCIRCGLVCAHEVYDGNGFCPVCDYYQKAEEVQLVDEDGIETTWYKIGNAGQLYWFAEQINETGSNNLNGILTADITVNADLAATDLRVWTPIGTGKCFGGSFDGGGYTVSGLYLNDINAQYVGLFGKTADPGSSYIKDITVADSILKGGTYVGGLAGYLETNVSGCTVEADVTVEGVSGVGGLAGWASVSQVNNCCSLAEVTGEENTGGLIGCSDDSNITNCYTAEDSLVGAVSESGGTVTNCYYLSDSETEDGGKTAGQFASGEVAYLLQGEQTHLIWGQNVGGDGDSYPVLNGEQVYQREYCTGAHFYSNAEGDVVHSGEFDGNGFCQNGCFQSAAQAADGYYEIGNGGQLFWFAELVNGGDAGAVNARLKADIDLENREWTPIGFGSASYSGHFDGCGFTVSNMLMAGHYITSDMNAGLFGSVFNAGIRDLTVEGSLSLTVAAPDSTIMLENSGLLAGIMRDSIVYHCYSEGSVTSGNASMGGLVGSGCHSIIINCGSSATVTGEANSIGGLVGQLSAGYDTALCLLNSYATGTVTAGSDSNNVGGLVGYLADDAANNYFAGALVTKETSSTRIGQLFGYISYEIAEDISDITVVTAFTPVIENNYYASDVTVAAIGSFGDTTADHSGYTGTYSNITELCDSLNSNLESVNEIIDGHRGYLTTTQWAELVEVLCGASVKASPWKISGSYAVHGCDHSYEDGVCTICGAADPNALFNVAGVNLALNNDITLYLYLMAENYDPSYTMEITKSYADGREVTKTVAAADWENYYGTMYRVGFNGIAAKEMTDEITVTVYDASGNAVSKEFVTTVADAAVLVYKSEANAASFTMMADLLNYGAAAQGNFRYNTDDLANTRLTAEQAAYASARFDMSTVTGKASGTAGAMGATLYLDTNIQHNFIFDAAVVDSTMTAKVSYTNYKGVANSFTIPGSRFVNNGSMITVNVSALTPADVNVPVTVQIVDANGAAVCSLTDSIAWYCVRAQASATNDLFIELMEFATSCNAYFG